MDWVEKNTEAEINKIYRLNRRLARIRNVFFDLMALYIYKPSLGLIDI